MIKLQCYISIQECIDVWAQPHLSSAFLVRFTLSRPFVSKNIKVDTMVNSNPYLLDSGNWMDRTLVQRNGDRIKWGGPDLLIEMDFSPLLFSQKLLRFCSISLIGFIYFRWRRNESDMTIIMDCRTAIYYIYDDDV